jgi:dimethylpropiothetin dethiomethylase
MTRPAHATLSQQPAWALLAAEIQALTTNASRAGTREGAAHLNHFNSLLDNLGARTPYIPPRPAQAPACRHLEAALAPPGRSASLLCALSRVARDLAWGPGHDHPTREPARDMAWCRLLAPSGPLVLEPAAVGLLLLAPGCVYPAHAHPEITETCMAVSGWAEVDLDGRLTRLEQGQTAWIAPGVAHGLTADSDAPCLLVHFRTGPRESLDHPDSRLV